MGAKAIAKINALDRAGFVALMGPLYEHSPWAAELAFDKAPFASEAAIAEALAVAVNGASEADRLALIRAHPELAGEKLRARALTSASLSEQASVGLHKLDEEEIAEWTALNATYRERFGFPFVICVRLHTKDEIVSSMKRRLAGSPETELRVAIAQIHDIARLRLADVVAALGRAKAK